MQETCLPERGSTCSAMKQAKTEQNIDQHQVFGAMLGTCMRQISLHEAAETDCTALRSIQLHMSFASCHQGWSRDRSERQHVTMHGRSELKRR